MPEVVHYGDISPETNIYLNDTFLKRGMPKMILGSFGQTLRIPKNKSQRLKCRRYEPLSGAPKPLVEGVTPKADSPRVSDVYIPITQYGNLLRLTDVVADTHEDQVLQEFTGLLGEQAAEMIERIRVAHLLGGTNVWYAGGVSSRSAVVAKVTKDLLRSIEASLRVNRAKPITQMLRSTPAFNTENVKPCYIGVCHPYMVKDIEDIDGFKSYEDYGSTTPYDNEIGSVGSFRFLVEEFLDPWADAGGNVPAGLISTSGTKCDVFPLLILARDAFADVALKGYETKNADGKGDMIVPVEMKVLNPGVPRGGDELGQRGSIGYKTWYGCGILQDMYMARVEAAVTQ